ncbi:MULTISPECIES: 2-oxoglutarate dehydrogenase complex dihydrolipoyllysine-residue succinyltransferase [Paenibacillus]|uniref:Dihydrolipoyllysine-residue succinyltransferase component of 2-oxoglutarate dehydrogenase complex n=1 Tax=Paenibacillus campinasensis TaxID=66347 RepID=A0ABW9T142_9BACL|nr:MULTISPECIES: 2-oxoglutarate dehydrogenase complex dihydrolipoyllysine-residue succinyltransferase [Paenibacillus]MUG66622.1 2-oxoglutarate dehydrogenase complex dihydrolipoyllysine-residue succinyltransferase [Paenibacillus campinasensis]PAK50481.1 dihydrolipoyllysine-residue succinyltransferase [Paenibacillus sp. 7541]
MSEITVPAMGESITEGTIFKWHVKEGDAVSVGDVLLELETDKVNLEISAEAEGVVEKILRQEGENVTIGEVIGQIAAQEGVTKSAPAPKAEEPAPAKSEAAPAAEAVKPPAPAPVDSGDASGTTASPSARKLARERGIDLEQVQGRDPIGRIYHDDVKNHQAGAASASKPASPAAAAPAPAAPAEFTKPVERVRMSRRRQTIANRLVEAQHTAAMLTTFNEVDMSAILDLRKRRKDSFKEKFEVNLGFMSFFTKAVVGALKKFPLLNAEIDGEDIIVKKFYDIGIAVSAKEGLVVPVVRDADRLGFAEIEKEIVNLAGKARNNSLSLSELQGGTFTITNGGVFGSLLSTPILNTPQVGILGMHKIQLRPVAIDEERMENRPMMYIALSYDHRIVDGAEAVSFLVTVKQLLEDPESLLLEG